MDVNRAKCRPARGTVATRLTGRPGWAFLGWLGAQVVQLPGATWGGAPSRGNSGKRFVEPLIINDAQGGF